jgi:hypothetical protein
LEHMEKVLREVQLDHGKTDKVGEFALCYLTMRLCLVAISFLCLRRSRP